MMNPFPRSLAALAALSLAACDSGTPETPESEPTATPLDDLSTAPLTLPEALQGRWGLTRNDCTGPASAAKGLLTIEPGRLVFYESRGTLDKIVEFGANHIRANFAFTGEGMEWDREILLETRRDGAELMRSEFGEEALGEPLTYLRCGEGETNAPG